MTAIDRLAFAPADSARAASHDHTGAIRIWLWSLAFLVFAMVVVGGATRLTESGLSITRWQPISGIVPPLNPTQWDAEFARYREIRQYAQLFPDMTLAGFKAIFFWEWSHRLLGRIIGLAIAAPLAWFWWRGALTRPLAVRLVGLLALVGLQGAVGWWMVASGLADRVEVAPERLATHLLLASLTFAALVSMATGLRPASREAVPRRLRTVAAVLVGAVLLQITLGGLVAGARAGWTDNTWPLMNGVFVPPVSVLAAMTPGWANFTENVITVQFDHRMVAYAVLIIALWHAVDSARAAAGSAAARRATALVALILCQAAIGITTLLLVVPLWAGLLHQAFAMFVLAMSVAHRRAMTRGENITVSGYQSQKG